ncbi:hypothetical protein [Alkaliphilus sp. B6464]|uniref:hypothetical protein n=1 Tax=Alkaliphilus sp. B6464 TaxID=2731219 RepID=UPI001BA7EC35|nr:hypothetical protein [Alkaliphilus sp. B6464]QUH21098.1 hypothetical protein HYG84_15225 [Alkaliphilus sp. B6464]
MDRLTKRIEDKVYYTKGKYSPETLCAEMETWEIRECMRKLADYEDTGLTPKEILIVVGERNALAERCGGTIPVYCGECELWGKKGWSQHQIGYCEGNGRPHKATDFCSYGKKKQE